MSRDLPIALADVLMLAPETHLDLPSSFLPSLSPAVLQSGSQSCRRGDGGRLAVVNCKGCVCGCTRGSGRMRWYGCAARAVVTDAAAAAARAATFSPSAVVDVLPGRLCASLMFQLLFPLLNPLPLFCNPSYDCLQIGFCCCLSVCVEKERERGKNVYA